MEFVEIYLFLFLCFVSTFYFRRNEIIEISKEVIQTFVLYIINLEFMRIIVLFSFH